MAFTDYEKAYYSVLTAAVLEALTNQGIKETYIRLLEDTYKKCTGRIAIHKQIYKFPIRKAVRRRDIISPKQFTAFQEGLF